jgi:uncharacterized protein (UPF0261 family)
MTVATRGKIAIAAALDTKGDEAAFMRDMLRERGHDTLLIDIGVLGDPTVQPDFSSEDVLLKGGSSREHLLHEGDRAHVVDALVAGIEVLALELYEQGTLLGIIAVGGSGGTTIGTAAMRTLPIGVPKVMVSTIASSDVQPYVGMKDICMVNSVVDFSGVNAISEPILQNACGAIMGMIDMRNAHNAGLARATSSSLQARTAKPLVAASMFGVTTPCVDKARRLLQDQGFELVPFHATGIGGKTMESLIEDGFFDAVLDVTTTEWADEVVGGTLTAGPTRLEAAARAGLPQVVAPGALDMVNFYGSGGLPEQFRGRKIHRHNDNVILMRTTAEECSKIGKRIAEKLNACRGPVTFMFPRLGVSALDLKGGIFYDPEANTALLEAFKQFLLPKVDLKIIDAHINDDVFAQACCQELLTNIERTAGSLHA